MRTAFVVVRVATAAALIPPWVSTLAVAQEAAAANAAGAHAGVALPV